MLQEAIEHIQKTTHRPLEFVEEPKSEGTKFCFVNPDTGVVSSVEVEPKRSHVFDSLGSIEHFMAMSADAFSAASAWVNDSGVIVALDDREFARPPTRPHFGEMKFILSPEASTLLDMQEQKYGHRDLLRILRVKLNAPDDLIAAFRSLNWENVMGSRQHIEHGKESMGKTISGKVSGEKALPEDCVLTIPVYENQEFPMQAVRCAVTLLPAEEKIMFEPVVGEVETAVVNSVLYAKDRIGKVIERTFLGKW